MRVLYLLFSIACFVGGFVEVATGLVLAGVMTMLLAAVVFSLHGLSGEVEALRDRVDTLERGKEPAPAASTVAVAVVAPAAEALSEPTAADIEAATALLTTAQDHHFSKRFAEARAAYAQIVERYANTKQASTARQQLENLRGA